MNWKFFINDKSKRAFDQLVAAYPDGPLGFSLDSHDKEYTDIRNELLEVHKAAKDKTSDSKLSEKYPYDLEFALGLYSCLIRHGFRHWQAADAGCWAYLSIRVIPDIVYERWGGYNADRFYKRSRRRWLMSLWWYVYLADDGDAGFNAEQTREILTNGSEDLIYLLLDHPQGGYRDRLCHVLLRKCHEVCSTKKLSGSREKFYRAVMVQHQIRASVVDPVIEGESDYVDAVLGRVLPKFSEA